MVKVWRSVQKPWSSGTSTSEESLTFININSNSSWHRQLHIHWSNLNLYIGWYYFSITSSLIATSLRAWWLLNINNFSIIPRNSLISASSVSGLVTNTLILSMALSMDQPVTASSFRSWSLNLMKSNVTGWSWISITFRQNSTNRQYRIHKICYIIIAGSALEEYRQIQSTLREFFLL